MSGKPLKSPLFPRALLSLAWAKGEFVSVNEIFHARLENGVKVVRLTPCIHWKGYL